MSRDPDLFDYPLHPGFKEHTTSMEAAIAIAPQVTDLQRDILRELAKREMAPDQCADVLGRSLLAIRPRFTELKLMGLIEETGRRHINRSGLNAKIYRSVTCQS